MERVWSIITDILSAVFLTAVFGYLGYRCIRNSEDRGRLIFKWFLSAGILALGIYELRHCDPRYIVAIALLMGISLACVWVGAISNMFANPIAAMFDGGRAEMEAKPMYSYAEARRKRGQSREAIEEVRKEMAKFPDDFNGVLLLASIQAEDLKDLPAAKATIETFVQQSGRTPQAVFAALQNLADLQWRFVGAQPAIATLQRIVHAYPDSQFAHGATQRIAHLEAADATRRQRVEAHFAVPSGERDVGLRAGLKGTPKAAGPAEEMERLVQQLERHPADVESRESLAMLYAQEADRPDLAVNELEQLIALRAESPRRIGHWLNLLATVHARFGHDVVAAQDALHRIMERFPKSSMAEAAVARLASLNLEVKANQQTEAKTIGSYEKQIGLKRNYGPPDPASV